MFCLGGNIMRSKNISLMMSIKEFIESCFENDHRMPTVREIAKEMNISTSCSHRYLVEMAEKNMISYVNGKMSTDKIDKMNLQTNSAAVVGSIPCGTPDEREAYIEDYVPLPISIFGEGDLYILHAQGDSMIYAGISDGDLIVIKKQNHANIGDIVVALDDENRNTLKTLCYNEKMKRYYLHPENNRYDDIYVKDLVIQGIASHVIKQL